MFILFVLTTVPWLCKRLTLAETGYLGNGYTGTLYYPCNVSVIFQNEKFVNKIILRLRKKKKASYGSS